ncbi:MAG: hypothetical protein ABW071_10595 [Casimicrobiaceae bacterium]|jgi:hypothetical protein
MNELDTVYAPAASRDRFLQALDGEDRQLPVRLAADLASCANPLPSLTCQLLGLPFGSSYGTAARRVLERWRDSGIGGADSQDAGVTPISSSATPQPVPVA